MNGRGSLIDRATQRWVRATGRRVDLSVDHWLDGTVGRTESINTSWLDDETSRLGGSVASDPDQGLLPSMALLDRGEFWVADLHDDVVHFYEHTRAWRMDVWSQWSPSFLPGAP